MKQMIIVFIIGFLAGAILATGIFYIYSTARQCKPKNENFTQNNFSMPNTENGQPSQLPGRQNSDDNRGDGSNSKSQLPDGKFENGRNGSFQAPPQMPGNNDNSADNNQTLPLPDSNGQNNSGNNQNS